MIAILLFSLFSGLAQSAPSQNAVYADIGFLDEALENGGSGFGIGVEHMIFEHVSFRVRHGIISRELGDSKSISHTVTCFEVGYYPKSTGLEGFNASLGFGYSNTQLVRTPEPFYQKIFPVVDLYFGYKFIFWERVVFEPYFNWLISTRDPELQITGIHSLVDIFGLTLGVVF